MAAPRKPGSMNDLVRAESLLQLAISLPLGCLIGWFAGSLLDRHFHAHWMGVAGILLGAAGGFAQIVRIASRAMKGSGK